MANLNQSFSALRERMHVALKAFADGKPLLVGDDGRRENEADLAFHASHATPELVNFAITHARGLLCVSVGHALADRLAFHTAPRFPGNFAHTNFTVAVDAAEGITSGISASDRAHTIRLMANPHAGAQDFISPGHVFPVRANESGLLARTGHTEALLELCRLTHLPPAAAMCEVLAASGDPLRPGDLAALPASDAFAQLPYVSTVDILWYCVFNGPQSPHVEWVKTRSFEASAGTQAHPRTEAWHLKPGAEAHLLIPSALYVHRSELRPEKLRLVASNGLQTWDNGVQDADAEIYLLGHGHLGAPIEGEVEAFCDLSGREGIAGTKVYVKRNVSWLRALQHVFQLKGLAPARFGEFLQDVRFPHAPDAEFLSSALGLSGK